MSRRKLVRKVGEGSYGQVFAAVNNKTGGLFAVKSVWLNGHGDQTHKVVADTEAEIGLLSKLDHQNIVKYLGSHVDEDYFYMYMEFVSGGSLNDTSGIPRRLTLSSFLYPRDLELFCIHPV